MKFITSIVILVTLGVAAAAAAATGSEQKALLDALNERSTNRKVSTKTLTEAMASKAPRHFATSSSNQNPVPSTTASAARGRYYRGECAGNCRVVALYDHNAKNFRELSFRKGDYITVNYINDRSGMWNGRRAGSGAVGWFPSNYVKRVLP